MTRKGTRVIELAGFDDCILVCLRFTQEYCRSSFLWARQLQLESPDSELQGLHGAR
jgi:hypothetical protein